MELSIFSCKDVLPKRAVALQILGYSTISVLRELFEQEPSIHFKDLEDFESAVESVNILPEVWEKARGQNIFAEKEKIEIFAFLRSIEANLLAPEDLELCETQITNYIIMAPEPVQISRELFENGELSKEKSETIMKLFNEPKQPSLPLPEPSLPLPQPSLARGRSKTLRVKGRRGLTPMKPSKKKIHKTNTN
jgi:hypothetical protein